jgi:uncharacterized protein
VRGYLQKVQLALVTGASSGLGKALAHELAKRGIPLILAARNRERLEAAAAELPGSPLLCVADLADPEERRKVVEIIHNKQPDLIVNNAGFGLYGPTLAHRTSELQEMVEVNVQALMELSLEGAGSLIEHKRKGMVLNISSAAGFFAYPTFSVYSATKAFVNSFSRALDEEMKPRGIRIITVCPGQIDTGFRKKASGNFPQKKDRVTMTPERAATLILEQADKGKSLSIVDWRYRLAVGLSRLVPYCLLSRLLSKGITERHAFHQNDSQNR